MAVKTGRNTQVGIGAESTHGTAVPISNWFPHILSVEGSRNATFKPVPSLRTSSGGAGTARSFYQEREAPSGTLSILPTFENTGMWLKAFMGDSASTGAGPYTHTYTKGILESYTMEIIRGTDLAGSLGTAETFEGVKFGKFRLRGRAGGLVEAMADWTAETAASRTTAGSPSYGSGATLIRGWKAGQFSWNSVSYTINDFELSVDHSLIDRLQLGSLFSAVPAEGQPVIKFRVTLDYDVDTPYTAHVAGTQADGSLVFTDGSQSLTVNVQNAWIDKVGEPISGHDVIKQTLDLVCIGDGTDHGASIVVVNGNSSATAN